MGHGAIFASHTRTQMVGTLIRRNKVLSLSVTFWPSKMSLSMPRGPKVERTVSITAFTGASGKPEWGRRFVEGEGGGGAMKTPVALVCNKRFTASAPSHNKTGRQPLHRGRQQQQFHVQRYILVRMYICEANTKHLTLRPATASHNLRRRDRDAGQEENKRSRPAQDLPSKHQKVPTRPVHRASASASMSLENLGCSHTRLDHQQTAVGHDMEYRRNPTESRLYCCCGLGSTFDSLVYI